MLREQEKRRNYNYLLYRILSFNKQTFLCEKEKCKNWAIKIKKWNHYESILNAKIAYGRERIWEKRATTALIPIFFMPIFVFIFIFWLILILCLFIFYLGWPGLWHKLNSFRSAYPNFWIGFFNWHCRWHVLHLNLYISNAGFISIFNLRLVFRGD